MSSRASHPAAIFILSRFQAEISAALKDAPYPIELFENEASLLVAIKQKNPLLIIIDDLELCQRLSQISHYPLLMLVEADNVDAALDAGADDCLLLPLNSHLLQQDLRKYYLAVVAQEQIGESEQRYRSLFDGANDGILLVDIETGRISDANEQAARMLGYSRDEFINLPVTVLETLPVEAPQNSETPDFRAVQHPLYESLFRRKDGSYLPVESSSRVIRLQGRATVLSFLRDITERKQAFQAEIEQRRLSEALLEAANALSRSSELASILDTILLSAMRIVPKVNSANIMFLRGDSIELVRHRGYETLGYGDMDIRGISFKLKEAGNLQWMLDKRQALALPDVHNSPFVWADSITSNFVKSMVGAPIIIDGEVIGFVNLDSDRVGTFSLNHAETLQAFANQAAIAIQKARFIEQIQSYAESLEQRVEERTAQLKEIQTALANERNLLRRIIDTIPDSIYVKDTDSRFILINKPFMQRMGLRGFPDIIGKSDADIFTGVYEATRPEERQIMERQEPLLNSARISFTLEGQTRHVLVSKVPFYDADGTVAGIIGINHDITELKQTETRLDQVLRGARCLLWSANVQKDAEGSFQWTFSVANEAAAQSFLPVDMSDKSYTAAWLDAIHPDDRGRRDYVFQTHLQFHKHSYNQEIRIRLKDGTERWLIEEILIQETGENNWNLVGVCTDISERKQAEQRLQHLNEELELRVQARTQDLVKANEILRREILERKRAEESERQQRILAESLRDSIAKLSSSLDRDTVFDHLLSAIRPIVPHDAANITLIEDEVLEIVRAWGYDKAIVGNRYRLEDYVDFQNILKTGEPYIVRDTSQFAAWQNPDNFDWVRSNVSVPIRLDETIIGFLNLDSAVVDSFSQDQASWLLSFASQAGIAIRNARYTALLEERVRERTLALELEQAQLKAILDAMRDGVIYTNLERKPQYINQALVDITGYSSDAWLNGIAQRQINTDSDEEYKETWRRINRILDYQGFWKGETKLRREDGTIFQAALVRTSVNNHLGERMGIVTVLRDISDEKRLEEQKARFIAVAAHELRTPITNLKTRFFLMRRQPERFLEHINVVEKVNSWMHSLVEDMFDLNRFERGILLLNRESLLLQDLLKDVYEYHAPEAERQNIYLRLIIPEKTIYIDADENRLTQVLSNLLGNALRYTQEGGTVTIELKQELESICLNIIDNGKGIKAEYIDHIFEPFFRATEEGKGAGLGLAVVKEIVTLHGGLVTVQSEEGKGTTFSVKLPLKTLETAGGT